MTTVTLNAEDNKPKGKNIILDKPSTMYTPSYRNEYRILDEQLEKTSSEKEKIKLKKEYMKIEKKAKKWFADHVDPKKEKKVREKQRLLEDTLMNEAYDEETVKQLRQSLPFTSIGYDHINNSLEVCIEPEKFKKEIIEESIKKIRGIIGDEIDLTISPKGFASLLPLRIDKDNR